MVKSLVIVAHPDDETIWMGGTILKNKDWEWTIVSLCRKDDADRMPKFLRVCKTYNASPIISDLDDEKLKPLSTKKVIEKIEEIIPKTDFDFIYTHGKNGEYGHLRHIEIHDAVTKMVKENKITCKRLHYFSYDLPSEVEKDSYNIPVPVTSLDGMTIKLNKKQLSEKQKIVRDFYGFRPDSFESLSCNGREEFSILKI
jgi:LmbE family N-acetylglucosaminyl deacetylase